MPAKSAAQYRLMSGIAHGMKSSIGPSPDVAEEMVQKTPSKKRSLFMKRSKKNSEKKTIFKKKLDDTDEDGM